MQRRTLICLSDHVVRCLVSDILVGNFVSLYPVGARLVSQWRSTPFQMLLALDKILIESVHHVCYFFPTVKVVTDQFVRVCMRLKLVKDLLVLLRQLGYDLFCALFFFKKVLLALLRLFFHLVEVGALTSQLCLLLCKSLHIGLQIGLSLD